MSKLNDLEGELYRTVYQRSKNVDQLINMANTRNEGRADEVRRSIRASVGAKKGTSAIAFAVCAVVLFIFYRITGIF